MVRGVACRWRVIFVVSISSLNNEEFSNGHIVPCAVGGCEFLDNVPKYVALWRDAQAAGTIYFTCENRARLHDRSQAVTHNVTPVRHRATGGSSRRLKMKTPQG